MNTYKISATIILTCGLLSLAACSKMGGSSAGSTSSPGAAQASATTAAPQTYALRNLSQYETDANGQRINPLQAPANQSYYFTFDSSTMRPQDIQALNVQAAYLASHPNARVRLEGNTDDRGSREYNIGLGWRRDQSVARLLEQQGATASQVQMVSFGKERPLETADTPQAWKVNRRVDLIYKASQ